MARSAGRSGGGPELGLGIHHPGTKITKGLGSGRPGARSAFPALKALERFDFVFQPHLDREPILQLVCADGVAAAEPVPFAGPVGTGKAHLAIARGIEATKRKHRVAFYRADDLVAKAMRVDPQSCVVPM